MNSFIKSNGGRVYHYGYFNSAMGMWIPSCGQCTSRCSQIHNPIEGGRIRVCYNCLEYETTPGIIEGQGMKIVEDEYLTLEIEDPKKVKCEVDRFGSQTGVEA